MSSKEYFDRVANDWDSMRSSFFSTKVREKAYEIAGLQEKKIAADIGAGTGFITEGLLERGIKVIAVDQSSKMLNIINDKFKSKGNLECRQGDAKKLPLKDKSVDYVFANMFLHHVEYPKDTIKEMTRILKEGGRLVITDLDKHDFEFLQQEHNDKWLGFEREQISKWFKEVGLKDVIIDCTGSDCQAEANLKSEVANISIFVAAGKK
ncbi:MAG: class I SAM-dependent methyltransferase [Bacillota bacterium]